MASGGTSVDSTATVGADYGATFGDARIVIGAPIIQFGRGTINPGSVENGGDDRGLPPRPPTTTTTPYYSGAFSSFGAGAVPASFAPDGARITPAFFDTINEGPLSGSGNTIVIAGLVIAAIGAFLLFRTRG